MARTVARNSATDVARRSAETVVGCASICDNARSTFKCSLGVLAGLSNRKNKSDAWPADGPNGIGVLSTPADSLYVRHMRRRHVRHGDAVTQRRGKHSLTRTDFVEHHVAPWRVRCRKGHQLVQERIFARRRERDGHARRREKIDEVQGSVKMSITAVKYTT